MATTEFCLGFRFAGSAHLAGPDGTATWPPEPCRVAAAMLAAASHHGLDPTPLQAIEGSGPEIYCCEDALPAPDYQLSVPGNQTAKHHLALRNRPYLTLPRAPVHVAYRWQVAAELAPALGEIGRRVSHLGAGVSLVTADCLTELPALTLLPDQAGHRSLRCAPSGYIDALLEAYRTGKPAPFMGRDIRYRWADRDLAEISGPWNPESGALRLTEPVDVADAVHFAEAVRCAVMSVLGDVPVEVHGHDGAASVHVAWVPIPHRDVLLGISCWIPRTMTAAQAQRVTAAFARLRQVRFRGRLLNLGLGGQGLLQDRIWSGLAHEWASVTPIALQRHPRRNLTAEQILADGLVADGYPEPQSIRITQWGANARTRHSRAPRVHAVIRWQEPLRGPVLLGAERHFGLGLCRPRWS